MIYKNLTLFEYAEQEATESAITVVEENNSPSPLDEAEKDALTNLRHLPEKVSSDTILPNLAKYGFTDTRAMGPIMRRLAKAGAIKATGEYRKSQRIGSHRMPKAIYHNHVTQV